MRVFFTHASVGQNIVDGMARLHELDKARYPLQIERAGDRPLRVRAGVLYAFNRGNPGPSAKVLGFADCISKGWAMPNADVVVNKFCYIGRRGRPG